MDGKSAIQIAEIIFIKVYGKKVLREKPWNVTKEGDVFEIEGTLPEGWVGGVATMKISQKNAEVLSIIHGK